MGEKDSELLFDYLRSILYDTKVKPLDIEALSESAQKLGKGLMYLDQAVQEMKAYSEALSRGNLSVTAPGRENFLCENLKNIHANLNHLTWQAKQVTKGDYSQEVSYLGEFSDSFNEMTKQLREREEHLMLDALTRIGNRHVFYDKMQELLDAGVAMAVCYCDLDHLKYVNDTFGHLEGDWYLCHFVEVVKQRIRKEDIFTRMGGDEFCLVLPLCSASVADRKMRQIQQIFSSESKHPYAKNFSYGILEIPKDHAPIEMDEIIYHVDRVMYLQKQEHKESERTFIMHNTLHERFEFRDIRVEEADQAVMIEQTCFPPNEADSAEHIKARIEKASHLFMAAVDKETGKLAGFLNGISTNEAFFHDEFFTDITLYDPNGENIMLLGLDVLPEYRGQGLAREIVNEYIRREQANGRKCLHLTCLEEKVEMYKKFGFLDEGMANSTWGGEEWHEMTYHLA